MTPLWFACSEPERPTDPYVIWHYATDEGHCAPCLLKHEAVMRMSGLDTDTWLRRAILGEPHRGGYSPMQEVLWSDRVFPYEGTAS